MTEEERRRCCLLGGCGCSPDQQLGALAEEIGIALGWDATTDDARTGNAYAAAKVVFDVFGYGPFKHRLAELGLDKNDATEGDHAS